jgi:integrase
MSRHESGEIGLIYALILRKAAAMLADCVEGKHLVWERRDYRTKRLCDVFETALHEFELQLAPSLSPGSVRLIVQVTRQFLDFLENAGMHDFTKLTADDVRRFIINTAPRHKSNIINLTWPIKRFVDFINDAGLAYIDGGREIAKFPSKRKKVLPCFAEDETVALLSAVDTTTALGKRDYAIMKIALGTGLRGEDIFGLLLTDIDWRKNEISVVQSKTGTHISLPLMPDVGNAIADYILNARPQTDSLYVFLRYRRPYNWLGDGAGGAAMMKRYMENAGIRHEAGDGKTFHAFRRTVGTRLIRAEVPLPDTAQILGHKNIESTKQYIALNDDMLRVCCMDISDYSTKKEGLA